MDKVKSWEEDVAEDFLGLCGRLISSSKSVYVNKFPDHTVVFNANICTANNKIWFGDLNITIDSNKLQNLAEEVGETIYILREHDARFYSENNPRLAKAVAIFSPERGKHNDK